MRTLYAWEDGLSKADSWDAMRRGNVGRELPDSELLHTEGNEYMALLDQVFGTMAGQTVVDIGTGAGRVPLHYQASGIDFIGLDIGFVGLAKFLSMKPGAKAVNASAVALPFKDNCADLVLMIGILYEIEKVELIREALAEVRRVLMPGGKFIFVNNAHADLYRSLYSRLPVSFGLVRRLAGRPQAPPSASLKFDRHLFTAGDVRQLARLAGFSIEREIPVNHLFGAAHWLNQRFLKAGRPLYESIQLRPVENVHWLGRAIAAFSRRFAPYMCAPSVYYEMSVIGDR